MMERSVLGALSALLVADTHLDVLVQVCVICDSLGIERPEEGNDGKYTFPWTDETAHSYVAGKKGDDSDQDQRSGQTHQ